MKVDIKQKKFFVWDGTLSRIVTAPSEDAAAQLADDMHWPDIEEIDPKSRVRALWHVIKTPSLPVDSVLQLIMVAAAEEDPAKCQQQIRDLLHVLTCETMPELS